MPPIVPVWSFQRRVAMGARARIGAMTALPDQAMKRKALGRIGLFAYRMPNRKIACMKTYIRIGGSAERGSPGLIPEAKMPVMIIIATPQD